MLNASSDDPVVIVDLFAGAGGLSTGIAQACEQDLGLDLDTEVELHAINHDATAIETHRRNHTWATHYNAKIQELYPPNVAEPDTVRLLAAGPKCTHFSIARGGEPVSEQMRASAWDVLHWVEMLRPEHLLVENVREFRDWGPIEDGQPTRDGTIFGRWVGVLEALGYSVVYDDDDDEYGTVLNAADYGDAQSRNRLFVMASRSKLPTPPEPTHSDTDPAKPDRRTAADIVNWQDPGESIFTRDLENPRVQPLSRNTMARIAEGVRRHCDGRLAPLADVLETIGPDELQALRETVVPAEYAPVVADAVDEPFLVRHPGGTALTTPYVCKYYGTSTTTPADAPLDTVTTSGNHHAVCNADAFCLRQQSGGVPASVDAPLPTISTAGAIGMATVESTAFVKPRNQVQGDLHSNATYPPEERALHTVTASNHDGHLVTPSLVRYSHGGALLDVDAPLPTITTAKGGVFALSQPYLCPLNNGRAGQRPRTRAVDRPLMTVTASKSPAGLARPVVRPFVDDYQGPPIAVDDAVGAITTRDRFALCVPEYWPWGLDVRYRMLQPDELKQAQGFPAGYEIAGDTKKDITAQIGNAVPVHLARALVCQLLADETPSLSTFGGGLAADPDAEVPDYEEVASGDD